MQRKFLVILDHTFFMLQSQHLLFDDDQQLPVLLQNQRSVLA